MSEQPQEWTPEGKAIWNESEAVGIAESGKEAKLICDAHNAALDVEREKRESIESINKSLAQALDAERSNTDDLQLVLGALDSLGVALADHSHQWTEGERAIYEKAVEIVTKEDK